MTGSKLKSYFITRMLSINVWLLLWQGKRWSQYILWLLFLQSFIVISISTIHYLIRCVYMLRDLLLHQYLNSWPSGEFHHLYEKGIWGSTTKCVGLSGLLWHRQDDHCCMNREYFHTVGCRFGGGCSSSFRTNWILTIDCCLKPSRSPTSCPWWLVVDSVIQQI